MTDPDLEARARGLAEAFAERAPEYDREARFPEPNLAELRAAGLLGLLVPAEAGGAGEGAPVFARVTAALAEGCGATALMFTMHSAAVAQIRRDARPEQRARLLAAAVSGRLYGIAYSDRAADEGEAGVTASPTEGGWRLHGRKSFVTGAGAADAFVATVDEPGGEAFLAVVPQDGRPGIGVRETWDAMGMRASASHDLVFDGYLLDRAERLGPPCDETVGVAPSARRQAPGSTSGLAPGAWHLEPTRLDPNGIFAIGFAATSVGIAAAALAHLRRELRARAGGDPAALSQSARFGLADAETAVAAARALLGDAAEALARDGAGAVAAVNAAKLFANRIAIQVADTAMQVVGGRAYMRRHPLERLCRDARAGALMRNTLDQCREEIARAVLTS